jgi:CheY-like chemotaxis protein
VEDFESRAVSGGNDAIDVGIAWAPHVILVDISRPGCNGYEAALALGRDPRTNGIAIIAHTAFDEIEVRRRLTDSEFDGYVQKGWPSGQLVALITKLAR